MNRESKIKIYKNGTIRAVKNNNINTIIEIDGENIKIRNNRKNNFLNLFKFESAYLNMNYYNITDVIFFEKPNKRGKVKVYYTNGDEDFELEGVPSEELLSYIEGEI